ncbi:unnamed protein product [Didymodactylos carnosus]|uniref:Uncharacterized protein n=1 Tax=Didymodactylos carnosus TaxID=1234261 RepID=A0A814Q5Q4_9BILA|nr:unnamed protein product [Didymodactylos carnosus]CAF1115691.1 unnamed protein product [Didymodactylos carnosus]CAF3563134.1 unnamed protein product [Didymodactylos carnosus]CAF3879609.1 unnamed protein product [Didymodactylos carnosus]
MDSYPLKLIELRDFLQSPSILKETLTFKHDKEKPTPKGITPFSNKINSIFPKKKKTSKYKNSTTNVIFLNQKTICERELCLPENTILFADELDRKRIGIHTKTSNCFARNVTITSGAALASLIPVLTNADDWLIISKLVYSKRYCFNSNKSPTVYGDVIMLLNVSNPFVRCELLKAFHSLHNTFSETQPAYVVIDFTQLLIKWFKKSLHKTDQYHRHGLRWKIQPYKCSVTFGNGRQWRTNGKLFTSNVSKLLRRHDHLLKIMLDFNYLPTIVYSIQFDNLFTYAINEEHEQTLRDMGNGLTLLSVQNLLKLDKKPTKATDDDEFVGKYCVSPLALENQMIPEIVQSSGEPESNVYETKSTLEFSPPVISLNNHPLHHQQCISTSSYPSCYQPTRQYDPLLHGTQRAIFEQVLFNRVNKLKTNHNNPMEALELMKKRSIVCLVEKNINNNNQPNDHQNMSNNFSQQIMLMSRSSQQPQIPASLLLLTNKANSNAQLNRASDI